MYHINADGTIIEGEVKQAIDVLADLQTQITNYQNDAAYHQRIVDGDNAAIAALQDQRQVLEDSPAVAKVLNITPTPVSVVDTSLSTATSTPIK